eukprot:COSAG05_NODE_1935_length_3814_cov_2.663795_3_plen_118_part_00
MGQPVAVDNEFDPRGGAQVGVGATPSEESAYNSGRDLPHEDEPQARWCCFQCCRRRAREQALREFSTLPSDEEAEAPVCPELQSTLWSAYLCCHLLLLRRSHCLPSPVPPSRTRLPS